MLNGFFGKITLFLRGFSIYDVITILRAIDNKMITIPSINPTLSVTLYL